MCAPVRLRISGADYNGHFVRPQAQVASFRVPGAMQRAALRGVMLRRTGTVPSTGVRYGPGSAAHHAVKNGALRCVRGAVPAAFFIAGLPTNCRYFSIKVVAARKRIANAAGVNSGIPDFLNVFQRWNS
jgi:hypothetical protein